MYMYVCLPEPCPLCGWQFSDGYYTSSLLQSLSLTVTPRVAVVTTPAG